MSCNFPLTAYKSNTNKTANGKAQIYFSEPSRGSLYETIKLRCGRCSGCRLDRSRSWAVRCVHEASLYEKNCFITLTYNDKKLPKDGSLNKKDFQDFMKRLRFHTQGYQAVIKNLDNEIVEILKPEQVQEQIDYDLDENYKVTFPIRYYMCGEYGDQLQRPHYHAALFNFDFKDKTLWKQSNGVKLFRSESLESIWDQGYVAIGDVTWQSAAYIARYILKKYNGKLAVTRYINTINQITGEIQYYEKEFTLMSSKPGIARYWYEKFKNDVFPKDFTTINGIKFQAPSYYDKIYDAQHPEKMDKIKDNRKNRALQRKEAYHPDRLKAKEFITNQKLTKLNRGFENE